MLRGPRHGCPLVVFGGADGAERLGRPALHQLGFGVHVLAVPVPVPAPGPDDVPHGGWIDGGGHEKGKAMLEGLAAMLVKLAKSLETR